MHKVILDGNNYVYFIYAIIPRYKWCAGRRAYVYKDNCDDDIGR